MKIKSRVELKDNYIYKYGKFKDIERTLKGETLGFSKLNKLNDPFEASYNYAHVFDTEDRAKSFSSSKMNHGDEWEFRNKVKSLIDSKISEILVTCFTTTPTEPLMWAHYAENHHGVCYCFDGDELQFDEEFVKGNVQYSNKIPELYFFENSTTEKQLEVFLPNLVCTKQSAWSYENEIRYFGKSENTVQKFNLSSLKSIILGCRVERDEAHKIRQLVSNIYNETGRNIEVYYAVKDGGYYKMKIEPFKIETLQIMSGYLSSESPIQP